MAKYIRRDSHVYKEIYCNSYIKLNLEHVLFILVPDNMDSIAIPEKEIKFRNLNLLEMPCKQIDICGLLRLGFLAVSIS